MRDLFLFEDEDGQKIVLDDDVIAGGRAFEKRSGKERGDVALFLSDDLWLYWDG